MKRETLYEILIAVLSAVLVAAVFHRASLASGFTLLESNPGDLLLNTFLLEHSYRSLLGKISYLSPPYFYPDPKARAYTDLLLGISAIYIPLRVFGASMFTAVSGSMYLMTVCTFLASYLSVRILLGRSVFIALFAATWTSIAYPRFAQLAHLQMLYTCLNPLIICAIVVLLLDQKRFTHVQLQGMTLAVALFLPLLAATNIYHALFTIVFSAALLLGALLTSPTRKTLFECLTQRWKTIALGALLSLVLVSPLIYVFFPLLRSGAQRPWAAVAMYLVHPAYFWWLGEENLLWSGLASFFAPETIQMLHAEHRIGFGIVSTLFLAFSLVYGYFWRSDSTNRAFALAVFISLLLPLGIGESTSLWQYIYQYLPGAGGVRAVSRYYLFLTFPISLMLALSLEALWRYASLRPVVCIACPLMLFEQLGSPTTFDPGIVKQRLAQVQARYDSTLPHCSAFILTPSKTHEFYGSTPYAVYRENAFNSPAYRQQNPDVASNWQGEPFSHFRQYGEAEMRMLSARHASLVNTYHSYNALLAQELNLPSIAGHSGYWDPRWKLRDVFSPRLEQRIQSWKALWPKTFAAGDTICRLEFDMYE